jgi:hypothetical protein
MSTRPSIRMIKKCSISRCPSPSATRGICNAHYLSGIRSGSLKRIVFRWNDKEDLFLKKNYGNLGSAKCAKFLGRGRSAIHAKASRLGLHSDNCGNRNGNWKGSRVSRRTGYSRALKMYKPRSCQRCGNRKAERHHQNGNILDNRPQNIRFLCRKCHMTIDGRLERFIRSDRGHGLHR